MVDAMKWFGGNTPPRDYEGDTWDELRRAWLVRSEIAAEKPAPTPLMPDDIRVQLERRAHVEAITPTADTLIGQIPDVVEWMRALMRRQGVEFHAPPIGGAPENRVTRGSLDGGVAVRVRRGSSKSTPPMNVSAMAAADREVTALAFWASLYDIDTHYRMNRNNARDVIGLVDDCLDGVWDLATRLQMALRTRDVAEGMLHDSRLGLWTVRSQHYALWPELAAIFETVEVPETVEDEGLF